MKSTIIIVLATENDRSFFIHVHHAAYRDMIEAEFGWDQKLQDHNAGKEFDTGGINIILANDQQVGVVAWDEYPDHVWLKELLILPEYQGKGIGSKVIENTKAMARDLGKELRLRTLKENLRAKSLYERHGFKVQELTDIHWKMLWDFREGSSEAPSPLEGRG